MLIDPSLDPDLLALVQAACPGVGILVRQIAGYLAKAFHIDDEVEIRAIVRLRPDIFDHTIDANRPAAEMIYVLVALYGRQVGVVESGQFLLEIVGGLRIRDSRTSRTKILDDGIQNKSCRYCQDPFHRKHFDLPSLMQACKPDATLMLAHSC